MTGVFLQMYRATGAASGAEITVLLSTGDYAKVQTAGEGHLGIVTDLWTGQPYRAFLTEPCGRTGCRCHAILVETAAAGLRDS